MITIQELTTPAGTTPPSDRLAALTGAEARAFAGMTWGLSSGIDRDWALAILRVDAETRVEWLPEVVKRAQAALEAGQLTAWGELDDTRASAAFMMARALVESMPAAEFTELVASVPYPATGRWVGPAA